MVGYIQGGYDELRVEDRYVSKLQKVYFFISPHTISFILGLYFSTAHQNEKLFTIKY